MRKVINYIVFVFIVAGCCACPIINKKKPVDQKPKAKSGNVHFEHWGQCDDEGRAGKPL